MTAHIRLRGASPEWSLGTIRIGTDKTTNDPPPSNIPYEVRNGYGDEQVIQGFIFVEREGRNFEPNLFSVVGAIIEGNYISYTNFVPHTFKHGDDFDLVIRINTMYASATIEAGEYCADLYAYGTYRYPDEGLILRPCVIVQWAELVNNEGFIVCLGTEPETIEADGYIGGKADFYVSVKNLTNTDLNVSTIDVVNLGAPVFSGPIEITSEGAPVTLPASFPGQGGIWNVKCEFSPTAGNFKKTYYKGKIVLNTDIGYSKECFFTANNYHPKPIMRVKPEELDFGEVIVGDQGDKHLSIFNDGDGDLKVSISVKKTFLRREDPDLKHFRPYLVEERIIPPSPDPVNFRQTYAPKIGALRRNINDIILTVSDTEGWNHPKDILLKGRPKPPWFRFRPPRD